MAEDKADDVIADVKTLESTLTQLHKQGSDLRAQLTRCEDSVGLYTRLLGYARQVLKQAEMPKCRRLKEGKAK